MNPRPHPPIRAVTFDVDGTLYDSRAHLFRVGWRLWRHRRALRAWKAAVEALRDTPTRDLEGQVWARVAQDTGLPLDRARAQVEVALKEAWSRGLSPSAVPTAIRQSLQLLDRLGIPRGIVSDHPSQDKLRALGLDQGWACVVDASALGALKPDPRCLQEAAARMGCAPSEVLHVGDREDTDGGSASRAGARFLRFPSQEPLPGTLSLLLERDTG